MPFDAYARSYDLLYRDKDYAAEAAFVDAQLQRHVPGAQRLLELGCGTGGHAVPLLERGYHLHGIDRSETMLAAARGRRASLPADRAARWHLEPGDMRALAIAGRFDAAISLFHVVSYLTTDDDLAAALAALARHLPHGDVFLFDFLYGPAVLGDPPQLRVKRVEDAQLRVTRLAEPLLDHAANCIDVRYHLFVEDKATQAIEQIRETHRMRCWFWPELQRHARAAGFEPLGPWEWMTERPVGARTWLAHAVLRRT